MKKMMTMLIALVLLVAMATTAFAATTYYVKTTSGTNLRVRAGRGTQYEKIGTLKYGEEVLVDNISNGWAEIYYGSYGSGYVSSQYLSKTKPAAISNNTSSSSSSSTKSSVSSSSAGDFDMVNSFKQFENVSYKAIVQPSTSSNNINLRWGPSMGAPIMGVRRAGYELKVIAENKTWCQVLDETTGECGFMMKKFLLEHVETYGQDG